MAGLGRSRRFLVVLYRSECRIAEGRSERKAHATRQRQQFGLISFVVCSILKIVHLKAVVALVCALFLLHPFMRLVTARDCAASS